MHTKINTQSTAHLTASFIKHNSNRNISVVILVTTVSARQSIQRIAQP